MFVDTGRMFTDNRADLPEGVPRHKSSALASQLKAKWATMTTEEQIEYTEDGAMELLEHREMKKFSVQTVPTHAFQDARKSLETIEREVRLMFLRFSCTVPHTQCL